MSEKLPDEAWIAEGKYGLKAAYTKGEGRRLYKYKLYIRADSIDLSEFYPLAATQNGCDCVSCEAKISLLDQIKAKHPQLFKDSQ